MRPFIFLLLAISITTSVMAEVVTHSESNISSDTVWSGTDIHHVTKSISVAKDATLTIEPGAIVKFGPSTSLTVAGSLDAQGTESEKIYFTSYKNDAVGGDTNSDGASTPAKNDWGQITLSGNSGDIDLAHTNISYGGYGIYAGGWTTGKTLSILDSVIEHHQRDGISILNVSSLSIKRTQISYNGDHGIELAYLQGSAVIEGNNIHHNVKAGFYASQYYASGSLALKDNQITDNGDQGVYTSANTSLTGNNLLNNGSWGIECTSYCNSFSLNEVKNNVKSVKLPIGVFTEGFESTIENNDDNTPHVFGTVVENVRLFKNPHIDTYYVTGSVSVAKDATLTIEPGAIVKFGPSTSLTVSGSLDAQGTESEKIYFTSYKNDAVGGDTNSDGASTPAKNDWGQITLSGNSGDIDLAHTNISYGGYGIYAGGWTTGKTLSILDSVIEHHQRDGISILNVSSLSIKRTQISYNGDHGIELAYLQGSAVIEGNNIHHNDKAGFYASQYYASGSLALKDNQITDNGNQGVYTSANTSLTGNNLLNNGSWGIECTSYCNSFSLNEVKNNVKSVKLPIGVFTEGFESTIENNDDNTPHVFGTVVENVRLFKNPHIDTYYVTGSVSVAKDATLTIEPGAIVKFGPSTSLTVSGSLDAQGTESEKIYFTSYKNDAVGGDTNSDGASTPAKNDWGQITLSGNSGDIDLAHTNISYGGYGIYAGGWTTGKTLSILDSVIEHHQRDGISILNVSSLSIKRTQISYNGDHGIELAYLQGSAVIEGNNIHHNVKAGFYASQYYASGSLALKDNQITDNGDQGVYTSANTSLTGNNLLNNGSWGIECTSYCNSFSSNEVKGNAKSAKLPINAFTSTSNSVIKDNADDTIYITGGSTNENAYLHRLASQNVYVVDGSVTINSGSKLTIDSGVILKFKQNQELQVNGQLEAVGTESQRVYFTSFKDDSIGGDTNGDGPSVGSPNDWPGVDLASATEAINQIDYATIRYAFDGIAFDKSSIVATMDNTVVEDSLKQGINVTFAKSLTVANSHFKRSGQNGVFISHAFLGQLFSTSSTFSENTLDGLYVYPASSNGNIQLTNNIFSNNLRWGLQCSTACKNFSDNHILDNAKAALLPIYLLTDDDQSVYRDNENNAVYVFGNTSSNARLRATGAHNTYVANSSVTIGDGARLTLDPGAVFKFKPNQELQVNGQLEAIGTESQRVYFTSFKDDSIGGDTNGDGPSVGSPNDWPGVDLASATEAINQIDYATIRYAFDGIAFDKSSIVATMDNTVVEDSLKQGINVTFAKSLTVANSHFKRSGQNGVFISHAFLGQLFSTSSTFSENTLDGLYVYPASSNGNIQLTNNIFSNNLRWGLQCSTACKNFSDNHILDNAKAALLPIYLLTDDDQSVYRDNENNAVYVFGNTSSNARLRATGAHNTYVANSSVTIGDGARLTLDPGAVFKFKPHQELQVNGQLAAVGTAKNRIVFTSFDDSTVGEAVNETKKSNVRSSSWPGIDIQSGDRSLFENVDVKYAGIGVDVAINSAPLNIDNVILSNNATGVQLGSGDHQLSNIKAWGNNNAVAISHRVKSVDIQNGYFMQNSQGILSTGSTAIISANENSFVQHRKAAFNNASTNKSNTINNWWGDFDNTGPYQQDSNPDGSGDTIVGGASYTPYLPNSAFDYVYTNFTAKGSENNGNISSPILISGSLNDQISNHSEPAIASGVNSKNSIRLTYNSIDNSKNYKLRLTYPMNTLGSDAGYVVLTDQFNNVLHSALRVSSGYIVHEVEIPSQTTLSGRIELSFNNASSEADSYISVSEVMLYEDPNAQDFENPQIIAVKFNDSDGNGATSLGDSYYIEFSEPMLETALLDQSALANSNLPAVDGSGIRKQWGNINTVKWNENRTQVEILLTTGFTVLGDEILQPSAQLTDRAGNPVNNTYALTLDDSIKAQVKSIKPNYISPTSAVSDFSVRIQYDSRMNSEIKPNVTLSSTGSSQPISPADGEWITVFYPNDTYVTKGVDLSEGMDGDIHISVTGAKDWAENLALDVENEWVIQLDATAPITVPLSISNQSCNSININWSNYQAPADVAGYRLYRNTEAFSSLDDLNFDQWLSKSARTYQVKSIEFNTSYFVAAVAVDSVGNFNSNVASTEIKLTSAIPQTVTPTLSMGRTPTDLIIDWSQYASALNCPLAGYRIYVAQQHFSDLAGLTPAHILNPDQTKFELSNIDRSSTYYISVVPFNDVEEIPEVLSVHTWSDPLSGDIATSLTLDATNDIVEIQTPITITLAGSLTVEAGVELRFAQGAGIEVNGGSLHFNGTVFEPIKLTSANVAVENTVAAGDWNGISITNGNTIDHVIEHAMIEYAQDGLTVDAGSALIDSITVLHSSNAGLSIKGGANLVSQAALFKFNAVGISVDENSQLVLKNSVIKNNTLNASILNNQTDLTENWWGSGSIDTVNSNISGSPVVDPVLKGEPVLSPAIALHNNQDVVTDTIVSLKVPSRNIEEMRISEDADFKQDFYEAWQETPTLTISDEGGSKTLYAQYKSITGAESAVIELPITYISDKPIIQALNIVENQLIGRPLEVTANAVGPLPINTMTISIDQQLLKSQTGDQISYTLHPQNFAKGESVLKIIATDQAGQVATVEKLIRFNLFNPDAPTIQSPQDGLIVTQDEIDLTGVAEPGLNIQVRNNGYLVNTVQSNEWGDFSQNNIQLTEGVNRITAVAIDEAGVSSQAAVNVILDQIAPISAELKAFYLPTEKSISLTWNHSNETEGETPVRYSVYRATAAFAEINQAELIVDNLSALEYLDKLESDNQYYYAVVGYDIAGTASNISNVAAVVFDQTPPSFTIEYDQAMPAGVGATAFKITSNEPLQALPSMVVVSDLLKNNPIAIALTEGDSQTYTGLIKFDQTHVSGSYEVTIAATDSWGNQSQSHPTGATLSLDNNGPVPIISWNVATPLQVSNATNVRVDIVLSEAVKSGTTPDLAMTLPNGSSLNIPLQGEHSNWYGEFELDASAGDGMASILFSAEDEQGNNSEHYEEVLELYSGDLPTPPSVPENFVVTSQAGGAVQIQWQVVANAGEYRVYRGVESCDANMELISTSTELAFIDLPPVDGTYCYYIAAVRHGSESQPSDSVTINSDSTAPNAAENLSVRLANEGVEVVWQAPQDASDVARYEVIRNGQAVRIINDLKSTFTVLDYPSQGGIYEYQIASLDYAGNTVLTDTVSLSMLVGAVSDLTAIVTPDEGPTLAWMHADSSNVVFEVFSGENKLHDGQLTEPEFQDIAYTGQSVVTYGVVAIDGQGQRSPAREIQVQPLNISVVFNPDEEGNQQALLSGHYNEMQLNIENPDENLSIEISSTDMYLTLEEQPLFSATLATEAELAPKTSLTENTAILLEDTLNEHVLQLTVEQLESSGNKIQYLHIVVLNNLQRTSDEIQVSIADVPLAGGYTKAQICVTNQGYQPMSFVVARDGGQEAGDLFVSIVDDQGLQISRAEYVGVPAGAIMQSDGDVIVKLRAGEDFCVDVPILVPAALQAGANIQFSAGISSLSNEISDQTFSTDESNPYQGSIDSQVTLATYFGTSQVDQALYNNSQVVTITGQAIDRITQQVLPNTGLKIGFETRGYRWFEEITTDENGEYLFEYLPMPGLSGSFNVWAAHPDVFDQLTQSQFKYYRIYSSPSNATIRAGKGDTLNFQVNLINPGEENLEGVALNFRAYTLSDDGEEVDVPQLQGGLNIDSDWSLEAGGETKVDLQLIADVDAPSTALVEYIFTTNQGAEVTLSGTVSLTEALPLLTMISPESSYVDTSINPGKSKVVPITLKNQGLLPLKNAVLTLPEDVQWMSLGSVDEASRQLNLGDIAVGEEISLDVLLLPSEGTEYGYHQGVYSVSGDNANQTFDFNVYALVTSNETGSVAFDVFNILGQTVPDATVRLSNDLLNITLDSKQTDTEGKVTFDHLKLGTWRWQVSASGHKSSHGIVKIEAGQVVLKEISLYKSVVSVEFRVKPVPFTDLYRVVLEQKFETHVIEPELELIPPMYNFYDVEGGIDVVVTHELKNHGLKHVTNVRLASFENKSVRITPLVAYLPELRAKASVEIPVKIEYFDNAETELPNKKCGGGNNNSSGTGSDPDSGGGGGDGGGIISAGQLGAGILTVAAEALSINLGAEIEVAAKASYRFNPSPIVVPRLGNLNDYTLNLPGELFELVGCAEKYNNNQNSGNRGLSRGGRNLIACKDILLTGARALTDLVANAVIENNSNKPTKSGCLDTSSTPVSYESEGCFIAGTPIKMSDGSLKPIETILVGDQVMTFDDRSARVTKHYERHSNHIRVLRYESLLTQNSYRVETTDEHLYWAMNKSKWERAEFIEVGDIVLLSGNDFALITETSRVDSEATVFNFDVEGAESYFANNALVYQSCGGETNASVTSNIKNRYNELFNSIKQSSKKLPSVIKGHK